MRLGQYLFIGFSLVIAPNLSSCSKKMSAVEYTSNMRCNEAALVIGPENKMPNSGAGLCNLSIRPNILGICGQVITEYQLLTWQVDGYDFVPAWRSIDVIKLREGCEELANEVEKQECGNFYRLNPVLDLPLDPSKIKAGYNLFVVSYHNNSGRFSVYNWSMTPEQNTQKTGIKDANHVSLIQDKCIYPRIDQYESIVLPSSPTN